MPNTINTLNTPIEEFIPDPDQPRKYFDEAALAELSESIKQYGILQPIIYYTNDKGQKIIVAGERRYQASKMAGLKEIPAISIENKDYDKVAIIENLLRQDLTPIEEAEALMNLKDKYNYSNEQLGKVISKATSAVTEYLTINKLPQKIKDDCRTKPEVTKTNLLKIARMRSESKQLSAYNKLMQYKEVEEKKDEDTTKKDNCKLVLGFVKSLTHKFTHTEIAFSDAAEKELFATEMKKLLDTAKKFMKKYE